jgi:DNA-binding transcriptional ArsR family regulator
MALAKKNDFPDKDVQFADWCKALSHPARITILRILAKKSGCMCGELVLDLPLAQSTVSQHLKALKEAGLIQGEVVGPQSKYCMNKKNIDKFFKLVDQFNYHVNE